MTRIPELSLTAFSAVDIAKKKTEKTGFYFFSAINLALSSGMVRRSAIQFSPGTS
jgi:hypothetical protein